MIIKKIEIDGFGKFSQESLAFCDGFNLVFGKNEDGKTTLMSFIKMMFYSSSGKTEKSSDLFKSLRKKYRPWNGSAMKGAIEFSHNGQDFRIQKEFMKSEASDKTSIFCTTTGENIEIENKNEAGEYFFGMRVDEFERSIFIGQTGGFSADGSSDSLAMRISNLTVSGDENVSHKLILKRLSDAIEELISKSRKKGLIVNEEQTLETLKFEEQNLIKLNKDQKDLELEIIGLEEEIQRLEESLDSISDSQKLELAKKELNAFYTLRNKQNLLTTAKAQVEAYDMPMDDLCAYIEKASIVSDNIEKNVGLIQELTLSKSSATVSDEEYTRLFELDKKADALKKDLETLNNKTALFENELKSKIATSVKAAKITALLPFLVFLCASLIIGFINPQFLYFGIALSSFGLITSLLLFCFAKRTAMSKVSVQLLKRDLEASLRTLFAFDESFTQKSVAEITDILNARLSDIVSELSGGLSLHHAGDISDLRRKSVLAQTEDIEKITEQLNLLKAEFISLSSTVKSVSTYSAAKILFVELKESLNSLKAFSEEIDTLSKATGIQDTSFDFIDARIKELGEFIQNTPSPTSSDTQSTEELKKALKTKRERLGECQSKIIIPPKSLAEISRLIADREKKLSSLYDRHNALSLAFDVMSEAITDANKGLGSHLKETVGKYLAEVSLGRYSDVLIPRDLSVETKAADSGEYHEWKFLSSGAIDRVYLCLRLAMADIITKDSEALPLFFDDILTNYDDDGIEAALQFLKNYMESKATASQILFFTCHNHIAKIAKNIFTDTNEISL